MSLPLEKATYRAIAIATTLDRSKEKKTPFVAVNFEIVDDENYAGETTQAWKGFFTDKTSERTVESLQHMGYQGENMEDFVSLDREGCQRLLPNTVEIVCDPESYTDEQGNERWALRVQWVNRVGGGRFKASNPLEGGELKAFAAQMKSVFRNARGGSRPASSSGNTQRSLPPSNGARGQQPHPNAPGSDRDDVPPF
jgi:hypothetical protein